MIAPRRKQLKSMLVRGAFIITTIASMFVLLWSLVNPAHLASGAISAIMAIDMFVGFGSFVGLIVNLSKDEPFDPAVENQNNIIEEPEDFNRWNSNLGLRMMATDHQLEIMNKLFELASYIDTNGVEPKLNEDRRMAFIAILQDNLNNAEKYRDQPEKLTLVTALPYSERSLILNVLRQLRVLGGSSAAPRIHNASTLAGPGNQEAMKFEELRYMPHQCKAAVVALRLLHADEGILLRASEAASTEEADRLLRPAGTVETEPEVLLRSSSSES